MMNKKGGRLIILLILFMWLQPTPVSAGSGTYTDGSPDTLTLNVLFEFDVGSSFNPSTTWEGVFNRASQLLFNATDGQLQIGTINFYNNCPEMMDQADIVIHSGSGGASAHVGGLGKSGSHVFIYNDTHSQDQPSARGQFGVVHELGHYVFGLYDSYIDSKKNPSSCINTTSTVATIMDGGTTVQPNNQRTEFALPADEATCKKTAQYEKRNMVDWPWIVQYVQSQYNIALTQPSSYETTVPGGHQALIFNYYECKLRAVVCLDRSGSMLDDNKISIAQNGAKLFIDLTKETDELGISSFASDASVDYSISAMNDANKINAKTVVGSLSADGQTDIGGGLQTSLGMITRQGDPVSNEVVILLSDGQHNTGTDPINVVPSLKTRGVVVYTIGLGTSADVGLLSKIAADSGGNYYFAADTSSLVAHFNSIFTQVRNDGAVTKLSEDIAAGESDSHPIEIDAYTASGGEATFVLTWNNGELGIRLTRPDGSLVSENDADVSLYVRDGTSVLYRMSKPSPGNWQLSVMANTEPTTYYLQVNSTSKSNVFVATTTDKGIYLSGEPIIVSTSVIAPARGTLEGQAVSGVMVTGLVKLDGVPLEPISLYDDGEASHGDGMRNDGIYSTLYNPASSGNYTFEVTANNTNGQTAPPDEEDPNWTPEPVDPFTRSSETTVVVDLSNAPPPGQVPPSQPPASPSTGTISVPQSGGGGMGVIIAILVVVVVSISVITSSQRKKRGGGIYISAQGNASLYFQTGPLTGQRVMISDNFLIGRSRSCNLAINDPQVSRLHVRIRFAQGKWFIQDQNSSKGTFVNGQRITATVLYPGNQVQIGNTTFIFEIK